MQYEDDLSFVIPTNRLRDVGETVEQYDEHFWRNGHSPQITVFDDSTPTNQEKYFPLLEKTKTHHDLYYVGPREKEQFLAYLNSRLRDKRLDFHATPARGRFCIPWLALHRPGPPRRFSCCSKLVSVYRSTGLHPGFP
jgi:hypothetical protein